MTEPKKFKRGKHSYTRWGSNFKEVRVEGKKKSGQPVPPAAPLSMDMDSATETGVYSNFSMAHRTSDEIMVDFCFVPPGKNKGKVRSRVILPFSHAKKLADLLNRATSEQNKGK